MSKIIYPSDGIYHYCRNHIDACTSNLIKSKSACNFDIPTNFKYRNYLINLAGLLSNYQRKLDDIDSTLQRIDKRYEDLSLDLTQGAKNIETPKIIERDRMIY